MEIHKVKELVGAFKEAALTSFSLKCDEFELELKKEISVVEANNMATDTANKKFGTKDRRANENTQVVESDIEKGIKEDIREDIKEDIKEEIHGSKGIKAPMVGTFYGASSPGAEPFVKVGDHVKKGDIVCVIEAMKLMNEVEAEEDCEIVEILVSNEDMVEYGQELFRVR